MLTKYRIVPFCPYHFVQYHFVRIPFCPYHFVRTILSATILSGHLQMKWLGPFEVIDKKGVLDYRVKLGDGRMKTYHVNMLKKNVNRHKEDAAVVENHELAAVITVVNDGEIGVDEEMLELFNS